MNDFTSGMLYHLKKSRDVVSKHLNEIDAEIAKMMKHEYPPTEEEIKLSQTDQIAAIKSYRARTNGEITLMWCKLILEEAREQYRYNLGNFPRNT